MSRSHGYVWGHAGIRQVVYGPKERREDEGNYAEKFSTIDEAETAVRETTQMNSAHMVIYRLVPVKRIRGRELQGSRP